MEYQIIYEYLTREGSGKGEHNVLASDLENCIAVMEEKFSTEGWKVAWLVHDPEKKYIPKSNIFPRESLEDRTRNETVWAMEKWHIEKALAEYSESLLFYYSPDTFDYFPIDEGVICLENLQ